MNFKPNFSFFRNLIDLIPEPLIVIDKRNLLIRYLNLESQIFFKKSSKYLIGKEINVLFPENSYLINNLKKIIHKTGVFFIKEIPVRDLENVELRCVVSENKDENILLFFKSDKPRYEKIFDENSLGVFDETFSILAHEINNPISSIKMAAQLIEKSTKNSDKELIDIIKNESDRISKLIDSLSSIDSKLSISSKSYENIHEIIRYSLFKLKQKSKKVSIVENFDPSLPTINLDKNLFVQVLDNLLVNAYESSNFLKKSYIKISTKYSYGETITIPNVKDKKNNNSIMIIIEDNGKGVEKKNIEKIFLPLFSTKKRGSGLGLFLAKKIINDHGGDITINSENQITSVIIKVPL